MNYMLDQSKIKFKRLKDDLDRKIYTKFVPKSVIEKRDLENQNFLTALGPPSTKEKKTDPAQEGTGAPSDKANAKIPDVYAAQVSKKSENKMKVDEGANVLRTYEAYSSINRGQTQGQVARADLHLDAKANNVRDEYHVMGNGPRFGELFTS